MSQPSSLYGRRVSSQNNPDAKCDNPNCNLKKSHHTFEQAKACTLAATTKA